MRAFVLDNSPPRYPRCNINMPYPRGLGHMLAVALFAFFPCGFKRASLSEVQQHIPHVKCSGLDQKVYGIALWCNTRSASGYFHVSLPRTSRPSRPHVARCTKRAMLEDSQSACIIINVRMRSSACLPPLFVVLCFRLVPRLSR